MPHIRTDISGMSKEGEDPEATPLPAQTPEAGGEGEDGKAREKNGNP